MKPISQKCSVCKHPEHETINVKLIGGASSRELAQDYGLGYKSIQNHKKKHLPMALVKAADAEEKQSADKLLEQVNSLYDKALYLVERADNDKKWAAAASSLKEARACLELTGKMIGMLKTATVNIHYNSEFVAAKLSIYEALKEYPEARRAVVTALKEEAFEDAEYKAIDSTAT